MSLINLKRWHSALVLLLAGVMAVIFAFVTANLVSQAMANWEFLREYGFTAIEHGAMYQVVELFALGAISMLCWMVFKTCEHVLVDRYLDWASKQARDK